MPEHLTRPNARLRAAVISCLCAASILSPALAHAGSLAFEESAPGDFDYARLLRLPDGFGAGPFTLELWLRPDDGYPVGPTNEGTPAQLVNWSSSDEAPYSSPSWWYRGNFLLDGHNNNAFERGTFSLQMYAGGRVRWLFGDGTYAGDGGPFAIQAEPGDSTPSLLDGQWHLITLVRRWLASSESQLELWIDGAPVAFVKSPERTDMRQFWETWDEFPTSGRGWVVGSEKQAAVGALPQYEDYKGLVAGMRFWTIARSPFAIMTSPSQALSGSEPGLVGWYRFDEGAGSRACNALATPECMNLVDAPTPWSTAAPFSSTPVPIAGWASVALAIALVRTGVRAARHEHT